ncbi:MAG TPA: MoxR family ATPase [Thermoanaerobaculia bacterium]|jgi:MoxR-like ATPase|nr:MoxR family ATPase [Thermoanaerobaculia bacterium]
MPQPSEPSQLTNERLIAAGQGIVAALEGAVLGQRAAIETLVVAFMAGGHALLEGVPGLGKTLLARAFASSLGVQFSRVQFTPDLMPADVIGTNVYDASSGSFRLMRGPVFTEVLMADEINRTPPKTQSALLEAMQERQVTIDGAPLALEPGFFVIATQNPIEFEGVYPLPEAQLDRFLVRIEMGLPAPEAELDLYRKAVAGELADWGGSLPGPVLQPGEAFALRRAARRVHVADELLSYLAQLADGVRRSPQVDLPVSPRAALALLEAGRASALLEGREFLIPEDLKRLLVPCWAHRILLTPEAELEGFDARRILDGVAAAVPVPH